jgi:hypothetical protein
MVYLVKIILEGTFFEQKPIQITLFNVEILTGKSKFIDLKEI